MSEPNFKVGDRVKVKCSSNFLPGVSGSIVCSYVGMDTKEHYWEYDVSLDGTGIYGFVSGELSPLVSSKLIEGVKREKR